MKSWLTLIGKRFQICTQFKYVWRQTSSVDRLSIPHWDTEHFQFQSDHLFDTEERKKFLKMLENKVFIRNQIPDCGDY